MDKKELLSSPYSKKVPAKQGRRAAPQPAAEDDIGSPDDLLDSPPSSNPSANFSPVKFSGMKSDPMIPPRSRKTGGWADELSAKSKGSRRNSTNIIEQERFQSPDKKQDSDDEIPLIPDMDELQEEDIQNQVARAPSVVGNKVASFTELDSDLTKKSAFSTLNNISLSLLTSRLYAEDEIQEPDTAWTWDLLFTEVASELRTEWEGGVPKDLSPQ
ncbi:intraflagellar transport protein 43 homolog A [Homalodisca vitripennis]|uniref:intraflagellar transport protein 43 homolog A n=1 Tax=Homalodisca vitripennis TaxID=197043 RepID=UPI001EEC9135|nr:intraflagellar transport protein 43 homolog A [Homalodisca vitripennis]XP_046679885.1 intraflagellar transport protein 43 homolog A [Homalodisca vitripennis]XP_046679886.1 intraflagellar transport protein 43 homolog A [Homalodisca vitripennis]XP_046679887.1 intraflagellar transport protein 43 homolog A [Homalodisca vitripennis]